MSVRVVSVPATHVYVRRLAHPKVERPVDPSGDDLRMPCFFDPSWLRDNADAFNLLCMLVGTVAGVRSSSRTAAARWA